MKQKMQKILGAGEDLLRAYVALRSGETKKGFSLFAKAVEEPNFDSLVEGIAKAIIRIKSEGDKDALEDMDIEDDAEISDDDFEEEEDDSEVLSSSVKNKKLKAQDEDDEDEDDTEIIEEDEIEEDPKNIEVPATVAKVLGYID